MLKRRCESVHRVKGFKLCLSVFSLEMYLSHPGLFTFQLRANVKSALVANNRFCSYIVLQFCLYVASFTCKSHRFPLDCLGLELWLRRQEKRDRLIKGKGTKSTLYKNYDSNSW
jgi:hypothetical protein